MPKVTTTKPTAALANSTYEILQNRLQQHTQQLHQRLSQLNEARKAVFGAVETKLVATAQIHTEHNCVPYDMVPLGTKFIFGYNVHLGLKTHVDLSDVFSVYTYQNHSFHDQGYDLLDNSSFESDFQKLYKYYKDTKFIRFVRKGPYLYMVFQISKGVNDLKAFKWEVSGEALVYIDNRSDHEIEWPPQHDFVWQRTTRDDQREGKYPHISVADRVFVETLGGDLTIKIEDNTDYGQGIYREEVENPDQTLDDAEVYYAIVGNIILLKIRPYQEKAYRYLAYNAKLQRAQRIDALQHAGILLPDDQGVLFPNGYYLQTGEFKQFDSELDGLQFEQKIVSPNGEDFLYVFYHPAQGIYQLLPYNMIGQTVNTPIVCHGYAIFENGELCYFNANSEPKKHHALRIWQTPYVGPDFSLSTRSDSYLFKIGNRDIVRAMAECQALISLVAKGESYQGLYSDLAKQTTTLLDAYHWLDHDEAVVISEPLKAIRDTAVATTDEYEKVRSIRQNTQTRTAEVVQRADQFVRDLDKQSYEHIHDFVQALAHLRELRGEVISLKELRYVDEARVEKCATTLGKRVEQLSQECVRFLLRDDALLPYYQRVQTYETDIPEVKKVVEANETEESIKQLSAELEMLIEVVSNLNIADATQTTQIVDTISAIFSELNRVRAQLQRKRKDLMSAEGRAEFFAQTKLIKQSLVNYLDVSDTPDKCDEYANKLMVQLEELEGRFAEFDTFITQVAQLREEVYNAFESRKVQLMEARNRRTSTLAQSADRILKAVQNRVLTIDSLAGLNGYFASDLMVEKLRKIIHELQQLGDSVKADDVQSRLKSAREDAVRQQKDRTELFVNGQNIIRLGEHTFSVNTADLALTTVAKDDHLYYHLTGTNFYERIDHPHIEAHRTLWDQSLVSETPQVYRAEFLAYQLYQAARSGSASDQPSLADVSAMDAAARLDYVQQYMAARHDEGYVKGVHDQDAAHILEALTAMHQAAGLLRYPAEARTCAALCWLHFLDQDSRAKLNHQLKGAGAILRAFPHSRAFGRLQATVREAVSNFVRQTELFDDSVVAMAGEYLFYELISDDHFVVDQTALILRDAFMQYLEDHEASASYQSSVRRVQDDRWVQYDLMRKWVRSFAEQTTTDARFVDETALLLFSDQLDLDQVTDATLQKTLEGMHGNHPLLKQGTYVLDYHRFISRLAEFRRNGPSPPSEGFKI